MEKQILERLVRDCAIETAADVCKKYYVPAAVSGRHVHLSEKDLQVLFGSGYRLQESKPLSQHGQFACAETVDFFGNKGCIKKIRVLGPVRGETQMELSTTDCYRAGVEPVIRMSGDIAGTPGGKIAGPAGTVEIKIGVIVAARHMHLSPAQALMLGLADRQNTAVRKRGLRPVVFENVLVRVHPDFEMEVHIDTDEANACGIHNGDIVQIVRQAEE